MYNQSMMKSKMGSPRKQTKNAKFFISKADDIELNQNMALAVQQKLKRKKTLEHGIEKKMLEATAKNKLGTFKMPSRAHQAFDSFYQSTMPLAHTPSPEKTRPSLLDAGRNKSAANLTLHSTLLGRKVAEDGGVKDPFATGTIGVHRLLGGGARQVEVDFSSPTKDVIEGPNQFSPLQPGAVGLLSSTMHNLSVLRDSRKQARFQSKLRQSETVERLFSGLSSQFPKLQPVNQMSNQMSSKMLLNQHKVSVSPTKSPRKRSPVKRRVKPRRGQNVNASQIMETNEADYDTPGEDAEPLREPHPEPSGDDNFSEKYEEESSRQSYTENSRVNSRCNSRIIDDDSAFERQIAEKGYNDYLHDSRDQSYRPECVSEKDIPVVDFAKQPELETKIPAAIFEDQEAQPIPESMKLWNEITASQPLRVSSRNAQAQKLPASPEKKPGAPVERVKTPVQIKSNTYNLVKNLTAPYQYKNKYLDLKPSGKEIDNETLQLLQKVMDKRPSFTNNYVNFNRPEAFAAQQTKPVEAQSPQKLPQPEVPALPKKPEPVEAKEDKEAVILKVSKFEEHRSPRALMSPVVVKPKPKVIQVAKQEAITQVIIQPKLEKFDYKFIGKKVVINKLEPKSVLAQRNSEAKVAYAKIELREEPAAEKEAKVVKIEPKIEPKIELKIEKKIEKKIEPKIETKIEPTIEPEAFTSVVEIEKPKVTQRRKSTGYERPKSVVLPTSQPAKSAPKVASTVEQARLILYQEQVKVAAAKTDVPKVELQEESPKMNIKESIKPKMVAEAPKITTAPATATSSAVSLLGKASAGNGSGEKPRYTVEAPRIIQESTERPKTVLYTAASNEAKDNDYLKMISEAAKPKAPAAAQAAGLDTHRALLSEAPRGEQARPRQYPQADKSIYNFDIPVVDVAKLTASAAQLSAKKLAKVKDDFSLRDAKAADPMTAKKEVAKQTNSKQLNKYLTNLNESQMQFDTKTDGEPKATKRERASTKKEKKAREEAKLLKEKEVRPLFAGSTSRVEMAPIVPPSNPMEDSQVYEVDIDIDTRQGAWAVEQKDEVQEIIVKTVRKQEQVKEQPKPQRARHISVPAASDYVNESFKSEEKAQVVQPTKTNQRKSTIIQPRTPKTAQGLNQRRGRKTRNTTPLKLNQLFRGEHKKICDVILDFLGVDEPSININRDLFESDYVTFQMSKGLQKLSMLDRTMNHNVFQIYDEYMERNNEYQRYECVNAFIEMLSQIPDLNSKYSNSKKLPRKQKANQLLQQNIQAAYSNDLYGGEVFKPAKVQREMVSSKKKMNVSKRGVMVEYKPRPNGLIKKIIKSKNSVVDFLDLKNVRLNKSQYVDLKILITDPSVKDFPEYEALLKWHELSRSDSMKATHQTVRLNQVAAVQLKSESTNEHENSIMAELREKFVSKHIDFFEISRCLTGFARAVYYTMDSRAYGGVYHALTSLTEGQFVQGHIQGYARQIQNTQECQVGYWKSVVKNNFDQEPYKISIPYGKWAWYNPDGSLKMRENYYIGKQDPNNENKVEVIKIQPNGLEDEQASPERRKKKKDEQVFTDYLTNINLSGGFTNEQTGGLFSFLKHHDKVYLS